jgi:beta-1,4-mannosyltransferase
MSAIPSVPTSRAEASASAARGLRVLVWPIDPGNPYTVALHTGMGDDATTEAYSPARLLRRYDVWHIHWPEALLNIRNPVKAAFKVAAFLAMIDSVRLRGGKIVWTLHNLKAHDALHPELERWFYRRFLKRVDGVISLSRTGLEMARERFRPLRSLPAAVIPHGHYRDQYPPSEADARAALKLPANARVLLFFGEVRDYKNVEALVRAFRGVKTANAHLVVAGRPKNAAIAESIAAEAAQDARVHLDLKFIANSEVARYLAAADLMVLPYRQILNSGAALLALSFSRPVLVPDLGSMGDLKADFGASWVRTFSGEIDSSTLESGLDWAARPRPHHCEMPDAYQWNRIRADTLRFYREVIEA